MKLFPAFARACLPIKADGEITRGRKGRVTFCKLNHFFTSSIWHIEVFSEGATSCFSELCRWGFVHYLHRCEYVKSSACKSKEAIFISLVLLIEEVNFLGFWASKTDCQQKTKYINRIILDLMHFGVILGITFREAEWHYPPLCHSIYGSCSGAALRKRVFLSTLSTCNRSSIFQIVSFQPMVVNSVVISRAIMQEIMSCLKKQWLLHSVSWGSLGNTFLVVWCSSSVTRVQRCNAARLLTFMDCNKRDTDMMRGRKDKSLIIVMILMITVIIIIIVMTTITWQR